MKSKFVYFYYVFLCILVQQTIIASTVCGYKGPIAKDMENNLDRCFTEHVKSTRLKMAIGYEFCLGENYRKLNQTVSQPYKKKIMDTSRILLHLADSVCSENESALSEFMLSGNGPFNQDSNGMEIESNPTDQNIKQCKTFFDSILESINQDNYKIAGLMKQNEAALSSMFPGEDSRAKIFIVVINIIKPLVNCFQPMEELKMRLIKKYLKQFLILQISPIGPSFSLKTLPIVSHPEIFTAKARNEDDDEEESEDEKEFNWNQKRIRGVIIAPERKVHLTTRPSSQLSEPEKRDVLNLSIQNEKVPLQIRDKILMNAAQKGSLTKAQQNSMTPKQKFDGKLISEDEYRKQVFMEEDHGHMGGSIEVNDIWNDNLSLKKVHFSNNDFDRYRIKGFDVDKKIEELFKE